MWEEKLTAHTWVHWLALTHAMGQRHGDPKFMELCGILSRPPIGMVARQAGLLSDGVHFFLDMAGESDILVAGCWRRLVVATDLDGAGLPGGGFEGPALSSKGRHCPR